MLAWDSRKNNWKEGWKLRIPSRYRSPYTIRVISYNASSSQRVLKEEVAIDDEIYLCILEGYFSLQTLDC